MTRIGLGLMRIAHLTEDEIYDLLDFSVNNGIKLFDLADIYGNRKCEKLVGNVLSRHPDLRNKMYIQTKVGICSQTCGYDNSYEYLYNMTKECIERLQVKYLDCLLIHRPDIFMDNEEVYRAVNKLKSEGLIKDFGVSNFSSSEIEYLNVYLKGQIVYNQVQLGLGNTTMIDQTMYTNLPNNLASKENDDLFFYLKKEKIAIQCFSPFQIGFFGGSIFDREKAPIIYDALKKYSEKYHTSMCAIATSFLLKLDKNLIVLSGSTNKKHILECLDGQKVDLSKEDWYHLYEESGHLLP